MQNQPNVHLTPQNIAFEGLNGMECRKWWNESLDDHLVKASIRRAQVEWAIQMPVFCIRHFEGVLHTMLGAYDRHSRRSSFPYLGQDLVISFQPANFTKVFDIPGSAQGGKKIDKKPKKMGKETKLQLVELVCRELV